LGTRGATGGVAARFQRDLAFLGPSAFSSSSVDGGRLVVCERFFSQWYVLLLRAATVLRWRL